jgi:hypothetical protein
MIKETCSCGATFEFNPSGTGYSQLAANAAASWRKDHKHEVPTRPDPLTRLMSPPSLGFPPTPPEKEFPDSGCAYCGSFKHIARECPDA